MFHNLLPPCAVLSIILLQNWCCGNQYDPHVYPTKGPYFEGWYVRLIDDFYPQISVGFLFGRVLPESGNSTGLAQCRKVKPDSNTSKPLRFKQEQAAVDGSDSKTEDIKDQVIKQKQNPYWYKMARSYDRNCDNVEAPLVITSILLQDKNVSQHLQSFTSAIPVDQYSITVKGKPVSHNPDDKSPPDFLVRFGNSGFFQVTPDQKVLVNVTAGNVSLVIKASNPDPWGPNGEGPQGWLEHLPLPLYWFVYSLGSEVSSYTLTYLATGRVLSGTKGRLHMEKNWGQSFPTAWIWAQGISGPYNAVLALSGGLVDFEPVHLGLTVFLIGYRNPGKGIIVNFTPVNSVTSFRHDGCKGFVNLNVTSLNERLAIVLGSLPVQMSQCILGPEKTGFTSACVESYSAVASVIMYKRIGIHYVEFDRVDMRNVALEFGGDYVCEKKCSGTR